MKNTKIVDTRNFDDELLRNIRPTYILEEDVSYLMKDLFSRLVLSSKEKKLLKEIVYFRIEDIIGIMRNHIDGYINDQYLK